MSIDPADPRLRYLNREHRVERGIDQLIGYCQGVLADGFVSLEEAQTLHAWISNNWDLRDQWPANVLYERLDQALADGRLDADEQRDLIETILDFSGGPLLLDETAHSAVSTLPFTRPAPPIEFELQTFCLTGVFAFGKRAQVQNAIGTRGGSIDSNLLARTNYLVVGSLGSADWKHASFGRKILAAVEWQAKGRPIHIVSEEHWAAHL